MFLGAVPIRLFINFRCVSFSQHSVAEEEPQEEE